MRRLNTAHPRNDDISRNNQRWLLHISLHLGDNFIFFRLLGEHPFLLRLQTTQLEDFFVAFVADGRTFRSLLGAVDKSCLRNKPILVLHTCVPHNRRQHPFVHLSVRHLWLDVLCIYSGQHRCQGSCCSLAASGRCRYTDRLIFL